MKIRSITYFMDVKRPLDVEALRRAGEFISGARAAFEAAGYEVQTVRLASRPFPYLLPVFEAQAAIELAVELERAGSEYGFDYVSLGPALPETPACYGLVPEMLAATQNVFVAGIMTTQRGISLEAVRACAEIIHKSAVISGDGFANLRFAALANVPPGAPFFPAAYHDGEVPCFALATEAADLAVEAFSQADSLHGARQALIGAIERNAERLSKTARGLAKQFEALFSGIDFTLAPFPQEAQSLGAAMERLGVPAVGLHGSLAAAAILTDTLERATFPRAGFNGLMLPVLEDAVLARRAAEGSLSVKDLLLYSTVCGTGLDTVPLPGDTTAEAIHALLLDLAALSQRLNKPLTARLMPIPGKKAGDPTGFDFAYFANSRVLPLHAGTLGGFLDRRENIDLSGSLTASRTGAFSHE